MRRSRARYAIKYAAHLNTIAKHDEMVRCSVGSGLMGNSKVAPTAMAPAEPWAETILADNSSSGKFADCLGPPLRIGSLSGYDPGAGVRYANQGWVSDRFRGAI